MLTALFLVWLQMSAQPQIPAITYAGIEIDSADVEAFNKACPEAANCFPILIVPHEDGRIKGTPEKGNIACETKAESMRCINAFGDSVELKFNGANPPIVLNEFDEAAQRAADETDGKPLSNLNCTMDAFTHKISPPECAAEPVDVPAVQETREVDGGQDCNVCKDGSCTAMWCAPHKVKEQFDTCADKSRVLLTSEDGKKHCVKF